MSKMWVVLAVGLVLLLSACTVNIIEGSGNVVTEDRVVASFDSISMAAFGEVIITQGSFDAVAVEAEDNLLQYIKTETRDGTLVIEFTGNAFSFQDGNSSLLRPTKPIKYYITVDSLREIEVSGAGSVSAETLSVGDLSLSVPGAGSITLRDVSASSISASISGAGGINVAGSTDTLFVEISGVGGFVGKDLACRAAQVKVSSAGSAQVWASDTLDISIAGAGSVEYWGDPVVTQDNSGVGTIVSKGDK